MKKITIIAPSKNYNYNTVKTLWKYKDLILAFAKRDIINNYAQTKLGLLWILAQAVVTAFIIKIFFTDLLKVVIPDTHFILYAFPGIMAWYFFTNIINNSGTSLLNSHHIITKVYFPKIILPIYKIFPGLLDFFIWLLIYFTILFLYDRPLTYNLFVLPLVILLNIITGLSIAIWLSAITVKFRDATHIIPYIVGFGVFITPIFYSESMIPDNYLFLIYLNPMAGVIMLYRWCFLNINISYYYLTGIIPVIILIISGNLYFKKIEATMAELI